MAQQREAHPIGKDQLDGYTKQAEQILGSVNGADIEKHLQKTSPHEMWRTLPEELLLVYALRTGVCLYLYLADYLRRTTGLVDDVEYARNRGLSITTEIASKSRFVSAYGLFFAGSYLATYTRKELSGYSRAKLATYQTSNRQLPATGSFMKDVNWVLADFVTAIASMTPDDDPLKHSGDLLSITEGYWRWVSDQALKIVAASDKSLLAHVEKTTFHYKRLSPTDIEFAVAGLSVIDQKESSIVTFAPIRPEEISGDEDVTRFLVRLCHRLALYDPLVEENPVSRFGGLVESVLLDGPPGTGKTIRQRMMMTLLTDLAKMMELSLNLKTVTADQIKSEWYGQSAKLIAELLRSVQVPTAVSLLFADDIDLVITGDRNSPSASGADLDIMNAFMQFFSGSGTNYRGNYVAIAATNKPTAADQALRQRFVYRALIKGPRSREEFADQLALELKQLSKAGLVHVKTGGYAPLSRKRLGGKSLAETSTTTGYSWEDLGQLCFELHGQDPFFTARSVKNAIKVAVAQASDFDVPTEWFEKPDSFRTRTYEERCQMVRELYRPLSADKIAHALREQAESEKRYRIEERERRVREDVEFLSVRNEAIERVKDLDN